MSELTQGITAEMVRSTGSHRRPPTGRVPTPLPVITQDRLPRYVLAPAIVAPEPPSEPDNRAQQEYALKALGQAGFLTLYRKIPNALTRMGEANLGIDYIYDVVVNIDKFKSGPYNDASLTKQMGPLATAENQDNNLIPVLARVFKGINVYSAKEYVPEAETQSAEPKPLFYIPANAAEARNLNLARVAKYHLGLWQIPAHHFPDNYPVMKQTNVKVGFPEVATTQLVFNEQFGDAERESSKGPLKVRYKTRKVRRNQVDEKFPISEKFFREWGFVGGTQREYSTHRPIEYLYHVCPQLTDLSRGPISPLRDFEINSGTVTDQVFNAPRRVVRVGKPGTNMVTIQGAVEGKKMRYTLGPNFDGTEAYRFSPDFGLIVRTTADGKTHFLDAFGLVPDQSKVRDRGPYHDVLSGGFPILDKDTFSQQVPEAASIVNNIDGYLKFALHCSVDGNFKLANFTLPEQGSAMDIYEQYGMSETLWQFLGTYGEDGIRSLIAMKDDIPGIFEMSQHADQLLMKRLLSEVSNIQKITSQAAQFQNEDVNREAIRLLNGAILEQARKILSAGMPLVRGEELSYGYIDLIGLLKTLRNRVDWHYSHIGSGESNLYSQTVNLLAHPDESVRNAVLAFVQRDWSYGIDLVDEKARALFSTGVLSAGQREAYDASLDLRDWESKTANSYETLKHILQILHGQGSSAGSILDIGTGQGRIGGKLARLGYKVYGLDISAEQLRLGKERIKEEGPGEALLRLKDENLLSAATLLDDEATAQNYIQVQGSFFNIIEALKANNISEKFPTVIITWHTYAEFGPPEKQKEVLSQLYEIMPPGAKIAIEMPDRNSPKYARALRSYHLKNPTVPYGTVRDASDTGEYPPRYFSATDELVVTLRSARFQIDPKTDIHTYEVGDGGDKFTENVFVATKPS